MISEPNPAFKTHLIASKKINWNAGVCLCLLLLTVQIIYFEGYALTKNPKIRPLLIALCKSFHCNLPVYRNLDELHLTGAFNPEQDYYRLKAAIHNKARFPQAYPKFKLTLLNYAGTPFAARTFQPQEYLPENLQLSLLAPGVTAEIDLNIAAPQTPVGGSSFELLY